MPLDLRTKKTRAMRRRLTKAQVRGRAAAPREPPRELPASSGAAGRGRVVASARRPPSAQLRASAPPPPPPAGVLLLPAPWPRAASPAAPALLPCPCQTNAKTEKAAKKARAFPLRKYALKA